MRGLIIPVLITGLLMLSGCASILNKDSRAGTPMILEPQSMLKFTDVPVPMGFKFLPRDSYAFESYGIRTGVLKYQGKASPELLISFYKEQMPMYKWNLLNIIEYGDRMLNFDRDNETCIISLAVKKNLIRQDIATVTISVGPKSASLKKSAKPIK